MNGRLNYKIEPALFLSLTIQFLAAGIFADTGLDFPSNGQSPANGYVVMHFPNPQNYGLPIWGPGGAGATYIWKYRPRQQAGYYVTMWWSNNGNFLWDGGSSNSYYGGHPYPRGGGGSTTTHDWEIATDRGGDYIYTRAGSGFSKKVIKDIWYTQALQVTRNANGTKTLVFYINLPSTADEDVIEVTVQADYGEINPPSPVLLFGDSPWYKDFYGNERLNGVLRHIKIFNKRLSQSDILTEAASEDLATVEGAENIWYMNINPRPDDIADKSGKGHHFVWANSYKAALWASGSTAIHQSGNPSTFSIEPCLPNSFRSSTPLHHMTGSPALAPHTYKLSRTEMFDLRGCGVGVFCNDVIRTVGLPIGIFIIKTEPGAYRSLMRTTAPR